MTTVVRNKSVVIPQEMRGGGVEGRFSSSSLDSRMPSLFNSEEAEYNKFSACLAATEGLRRMRDQALLELSSSGSLPDREGKVREQYQSNSGRVLRAMGMSVDRFNELGREIARDERLKDKVRLMRIVLLLVLVSNAWIKNAVFWIRTGVCFRLRSWSKHTSIGWPQWLI